MSRLLLTSTSSGHTYMHSSYISRRGIEKSLCMINTLSAIPATVKGSQPPCVFCKQPGLSSELVALVQYRCWRSSYFSQASLIALFTHWKTVCTLLLVLESISQSKNVAYRPYAACSCVKLHSKQTYGIRMTDDIYIWEIHHSITYVFIYRLISIWRTLNQSDVTEK